MGRKAWDLENKVKTFTRKVFEIIRLPMDSLIRLFVRKEITQLFRFIQPKILVDNDKQLISRYLPVFSVIAISSGVLVFQNLFKGLKKITLNLSWNIEVETCWHVGSFDANKKHFFRL